MTGDTTGKGRTAFREQYCSCELASIPIAQKIQNLIPLPNQPGTTSNYFSSGTQAFDRDNIDAKIDWNHTENHHIFGKYSVMKALVNCQFSLGAAGGSGLCNGTGAGTAPTLTQLPTLGHSWIITPNLLLDEVLGFNRMGQHGTDHFFGQNIGLQSRNSGHQRSGYPAKRFPDLQHHAASAASVRRPTTFRSFVTTRPGPTATTLPGRMERTNSASDST